MFRVILAAAVALFATTVHGEDEPKQLFDGKETSLTVLKAEAQKYVGKSFEMVGKVAIDDYYNWAYGEAQNTHYSLSFRQAIKVGDQVEFGEYCHLYCPKGGFGRQVVTTILEQEKGGEIFVRVVAAEARVNRSRPELTWQLLELNDINFFKNGELQGWIRNALDVKDAEAKVAAGVKAAEAKAAAKKEEDQRIEAAKL